jgi:hypothetical protein
MNDDREMLDRLLGGLVPPEPPRELQRRLLRKATDALGREAPRDIWTRLWESRPLRLAWAGAVAALLVANVVVPSGRRAAPLQVAAPPQQSVPPLADELESIARLPRIDLDTLPAIGGAAPPPAEPRPVRLLQKTKESPS